MTNEVGVDRIAEAFANCEHGAALMPYMMGGYPDIETSALIGEAYIEGGADLIEFGIPYSDPLADGPVIQAAGQSALAAGATVERTLKVATGLAEKLPVMLMTYTNAIRAYGFAEIAERLAGDRVAGLIVPDLPAEECGELLGLCDDAGIALIQFVAPTTTNERMELIGKVARGFIYLISVTGVTGERASVSSGLGSLVDRVRQHTDLPVSVGFGIGTPEQAADVAKVADGVIIGSRLVREITDSTSSNEAIESSKNLVSGFAGAL